MELDADVQRVDWRPMKEKNSVYAAKGRWQHFEKGKKGLPRHVTQTKRRERVSRILALSWHNPRWDIPPFPRRSDRGAHLSF